MRRTLAVAVLALWALIGLPGTAHAGGPTSVLITQPGSGPATALYYSSAAYGDLERALATDEKTSASAPSGGTEYNLTWMIHDIQPWRWDSVRITPDGEAYVSTTLTDDTGALAFEDQQAWQRIQEPKALATLLDRVFAGTSTGATAVQPVIEQQPAEAAAAEATTRWFSLAGWRWAVPGVLGGLLVGLVAARRRVPGEPRRALVDLPPERARV